MSKHIVVSDDCFLRYSQTKADLQVELGDVMTATEAINEMTRIVKLFLEKKKVA
jgi:hypothetical protein